MDIKNLDNFRITQHTVYLFSILLKCVVDCVSNELFASLLELEALYQNEIEVITVIERVIDHWEDAPHVLKL